MDVDRRIAAAEALEGRSKVHQTWTCMVVLVGLEISALSLYNEVKLCSTDNVSPDECFAVIFEVFFRHVFVN